MSAGLALAVVSSGCTVMMSEPEPEVVRIAADLELSGAGSELGVVYRNALELRVEQINQQGLLIGDRRLDLVVRDNRSDPAVAANNIREFANDPSVNAIVTGACADCMLSAVDIVNEARVPTIALAATADVAEPVEERSSVFKLGPNADQVAAALAREMSAAGVETLAVVATDDRYGSDGVEEMRTAASRAGLEIVLDERLTLGGGGLSGTAQTIAELRTEDPSDPFNQQPPEGPDAVVAWGMAPFGVEVTAALRNAGYEGQMFLDSGAAEELFITGSSDVLTGAVMIFTEALVIDQVIATSPAKANRQNWFNDYTARYGSYHAFSSFAADAVEVIVSAINETGATDRSGLRSALEVTETDGFTGPIRMSPQHHSGLMTQALEALVAREDRWQLAG